MSEATKPIPLRSSTNGSSCPTHPSVSIIVCTLGNRSTLWGCLRSLLAQECHHFETLVVLNGQPDADLAQAVAGTPLRLLNEPRRGVCGARNRAIPDARGEILAFVDDDVIAHPDWLHELLKGFEDPSVACVTGRVVLEGLPPHPDDRARRYFTSERALSTWTVSNAETDWFQKALGEPVGFGCNMAFRRSFLEKNGLFPLDLGAGSIIGGGDESYMFLRVLKHGFRIYHNPSAVVTHLFDGDSSRQKKRMMQLYACSVAFALKLLVEEKGLRWDTAGWLFTGLIRRLRRVISRRSVSSEPQELLSSLEKMSAYLRGPFVYWKSHRALGRRKR
jgi:cellulose synthase/poly-beta-1,6-N-acetylglucosamine synthase-like glycosyltransferase